MRMNHDYEPISRDSSGGISTRTLLILLLVAFIGGVLASGWIATRIGVFSSDSTAQAAETADAAGEEGPVAALERRIDPDGTVRPAPTQAPSRLLADDLAPSTERELSTRVADLENRLSRINVQAQLAGGNAARAEGLLIAFAARRALDRGSSLGYLESQLQTRFGTAQPNAVATIIQAGRDPVTMDELRGELAEIGPSLTVSAADEGMLGSIQRELGELFILRREGTLSPAPAMRLERAQRFLESGRVEAALAEVRRLPGSDKGQQWIARARRYAEARTALDLIETAAILEPRALRSGEGEPVQQASPLAGD